MESSAVLITLRLPSEADAKALLSNFDKKGASNIAAGCYHPDGVRAEIVAASLPGWEDLTKAGDVVP